MVELFKDVGMAMPFMLATGINPPKMNLQRITEAGLIAIFTALVTSYITVQKLDLKQELTEKRLDDQIKRRDQELAMMREQMMSNSNREERQYESIRAEVVKISLMIERNKK